MQLSFESIPDNIKAEMQRMNEDYGEERLELLNSAITPSYLCRWIRTPSVSITSLNFSRRKKNVSPLKIRCAPCSLPSERKSRFD